MVSSALILATALIGHLVAAPRAPLVDVSRLPWTVGAWRGQDAPIDDDVVRQLGADSYTSRAYTAGRSEVDLYVAFYAGQSPGDSIHSPLNCLPGTGWEPESVSTVAADAAHPAGRMRRMVVRKEDEQALVLYWYQVHGRMIASEWSSKAYLLGDSLFMRRSDAGFVRIAVPFAAGAAAADADARAFAAALMPSLDRLWSR
jgi:EpsI family protein